MIRMADQTKSNQIKPCGLARWGRCIRRERAQKAHKFLWLCDFWAFLRLCPFRARIKPNQTKSNQIKPNQTKSNRNEPNRTESNLPWWV
jgi:hypothetical protein